MVTAPAYRWKMNFGGNFCVLLKSKAKLSMLWPLKLTMRAALIWG